MPFLFIIGFLLIAIIFKKYKNKRDKNLNTTNSIFGGLGHFGSHRNIHWVEFYYNIIKEKYPEFI